MLRPQVLLFADENVDDLFFTVKDRAKLVHNEKKIDDWLVSQNQSPLTFIPNTCQITPAGRFILIRYNGDTSPVQHLIDHELISSSSLEVAMGKAFDKATTKLTVDIHKVLVDHFPIEADVFSIVADRKI